jgi:5-hydroxyisourate hydrolase
VTISTHVLDLSTGRPAVGVDVLLERHDGATWRDLGRATTDHDGRVAALLPPDAVPAAGVHRITVAVGDYFAARQVPHFHPEVTIAFTIADPAEHHHVPLLVSPFGYSTYRGS